MMEPLREKDWKEHTECLAHHLITITESVMCAASTGMSDRDRMQGTRGWQSSRDSERDNSERRRREDEDRRERERDDERRRDGPDGGIS